MSYESNPRVVIVDPKWPAVPKDGDACSAVFALPGAAEPLMTIFEFKGWLDKAFILTDKRKASFYVLMQVKDQLIVGDLQKRTGQRPAPAERDGSHDNTRKEKMVLPLYENMIICAGHAHVPVSLQKLAKSKGCPAFKLNGNVDLGQLLDWIFSQQDAYLMDWPADLKRSQALMARIELEKAQKDSIATSEMVSCIQELVNKIFFGELDRQNQQYPAVLKGMDEISIASKLQEDLHKVKSRLREFMEVWIRNHEHKEPENERSV